MVRMDMEIPFQNQVALGHWAKTPVGFTTVYSGTMASFDRNPNRRFDAVFCDVDGCLMPEGQEGADLEALQKVAAYNTAAERDGDRPVVVPCTGRPQPYAEAVCRMLASKALPAICEHGVWTYDFARHRWTMSPTITNEDLRAVREMEAWVRTELGPKGCFMQLGRSAAVTIFHDDVDWLAAEVVPVLERLIEAKHWPMRVSMTWTCINVDLKHVSKGRAIERMITQFGLDRARLAGIGDTMSDLAIHDSVAWFGCPGNADEKLKPHADVVATEPLARGVLELLGHLVGA
jgi:hydroxymethylpyrimidine pyrophosphatase-like HAD family hydrolase